MLIHASICEFVSNKNIYILFENEVVFCFQFNFFFSRQIFFLTLVSEISLNLLIKHLHIFCYVVACVHLFCVGLSVLPFWDFIIFLSCIFDLTLDQNFLLTYLKIIANNNFFSGGVPYDIEMQKLVQKCLYKITRQKTVLFKCI